MVSDVSSGCSLPNALVATNGGSSREARPIRGRGASLGPIGSATSTTADGPPLGSGGIRRPDARHEQGAYHNRRQLLAHLGGAAAMPRRPAESPRAAHADDDELPPRRKRSRITSTDIAGDREKITPAQWTTQRSARRDTELDGDDVHHRLRRDGAEPCGLGASLETSAGPASIEDDKMQLTHLVTGQSAFISAGEEATADGHIGLATAAAGGGGGQDAAVVHAAAAWARHAVEAAGAGGGVDHLSAA